MSEAAIAAILESLTEAARLMEVDPEKLWRFAAELRAGSRLEEAIESEIQERALARIRREQRT